MLPPLRWSMMNWLGALGGSIWNQHEMCCVLLLLIDPTERCWGLTIAWNTGLPLRKVRFDALLSSYFGESASNLRSVFLAAKEHPCVLLLDECDFIARSRTGGRDIGEAVW